MSEGVELDTSGLDRLIAALGKPAPEVKIGILADSPRSGGKLTNAQVGEFHEQGTKRRKKGVVQHGIEQEVGTDLLPVRSFLRVPLSLYWGKRMEAAGMMSEAAFKAIIEAGSFRAWANRAAVIGEGIVSDAFDTGGFGQWPASKMKRKKVHQTLVETQQLRNSVSSEVKA